MYRIQKVPPQLFIGTTSLVDKNTYLFFHVEGEELPRRIKMANPEEALQKVIDAEKKGFSAYASTFIPCWKQHAVFAFSAAGKTKELIHAPKVYNLVKTAYDSVFAKVKTQPSGQEMSVQIIKEKGGE